MRIKNRLYVETHSKVKREKTVAFWCLVTSQRDSLRIWCFWIQRGFLFQVWGTISLLCYLLVVNVGVQLWERWESKFNMSVCASASKSCLKMPAVWGGECPQTHRKLSSDAVSPTETEECLVSSSPLQGTLSLRNYLLGNPACLRYHQVLLKPTFLVIQSSVTPTSLRYPSLTFFSLNISWVIFPWKICSSWNSIPPCYVSPPLPHLYLSPTNFMFQVHNFQKPY